MTGTEEEELATLCICGASFSSVKWTELPSTDIQPQQDDLEWPLSCIRPSGASWDLIPYPKSFHRCPPGKHLVLRDLGFPKPRLPEL